MLKRLQCLRSSSKAVPDYTQFSRETKPRLNPNYIEDLKWTIPEEFSKPPEELAPEVSAVQVHTPPPRMLQSEYNDHRRYIYPDHGSRASHGSGPSLRTSRKDYLTELKYVDPAPHSVTLRSTLVNTNPFQCCNIRCQHDPSFLSLNTLLIRQISCLFSIFSSNLVHTRQTEMPHWYSQLPNNVPQSWNAKLALV